jgi:hypothetical protein
MGERRHDCGALQHPSAARKSLPQEAFKGMYQLGDLLRAGYPDSVEVDFSVGVGNDVPQGDPAMYFRELLIDGFALTANGAQPEPMRSSCSNTADWSITSCSRVFRWNSSTQAWMYRAATSASSKRPLILSLI